MFLNQGELADNVLNSNERLAFLFGNILWPFTGISSPNSVFCDILCSPSLVLEFLDKINNQTRSKPSLNQVLGLKQD